MLVPTHIATPTYKNTKHTSRTLGDRFFCFSRSAGIMSNFTRIKDRPTPYQPVDNGTHLEPVIKKRTNNLTLEDYNYEESSDSSAGKLVMDPYQTTKRTVISIERSQNELKYRNETSPCVVEMLKIRESLLREKAEEEQKELRRLKRKRQQQEQLLKLETAIKENKLDSFEFDLEEDRNTEMNDGESSSSGPEGMTEEEEEFKKMALFMKERRIIRQMQSNLMHLPLSRYRIFKYSIDASLFGGKRYGPFTEILPWLYIGRGSIAKEERFFNSLGFTHVMNCTREVDDLLPPWGPFTSHLILTLPLTCLYM
jgi:hypothetical protein